MTDNPTLENDVRETILAVLWVLHSKGINQVNMGGLLRIMGVPDRVAQRHDNEYIELSLDHDSDNLCLKSIIPTGTTLH